MGQRSSARRWTRTKVAALLCLLPCCHEALSVPRPRPLATCGRVVRVAGRGGASIDVRFRLPRRRVSRSSGVARQAVFTALAEELAGQPGLFFGEVFAVVALSTIFEQGEDWLRKSLRAAGDSTGRQILDALFREITILGFIGLLLFLVTHFVYTDNFLGEEEPLSETFELVHMAMFMLLVVLLFQGFAWLYSSRSIAEAWSDYESTRAFGMAKSSLESMLTGEDYIERADNPDAPRGMDLIFKRPFRYGENLWQRLQLRSDPLHKLVMWRAIRHRFFYQGPSSSNLVEDGVIDPQLFSFRMFLEYQLGQIVLALVEVDVKTWFMSMGVVAAVTATVLNAPMLKVQLVQCLAAWSLLLVAAALSVVLEEDTYDLTPQVPEDGRQILRLFAGTSAQMLKRQSWLAGGSDQHDQSLAGRRFRPGLPNCDAASPSLGKAPYWVSRRQTGEAGDKISPPAGGLLVQDYITIFRLLAFLQATVVTSLVVVSFSGGIQGWQQALPYVLAWLEWPLMLFVAVPALVRRLTVRAAVTRTETNNWYREKQRDLVRKVMLAGTEGLLRDCTRLLHLQGMEARAVRAEESWALSTGVCRALSARSATSEEKEARQRASKAVSRGLSRFEDLPPSLRLEVYNIFAAWDATNSGSVAPAQLATMLDSMGFAATSERASKNLIRLVDDDGSGLLTWRKCQALIMLSTACRPMDERRRDLEAFFLRMQKESPQQATVFELVNALPVSGITADDVSNLLYRHFGRVKPSITRSEFVEWVEATEFSTTGFE